MQKLRNEQTGCERYADSKLHYNKVEYRGLRFLVDPMSGLCGAVVPYGKNRSGVLWKRTVSGKRP